MSTERLKTALAQPNGNGSTARAGFPELLEKMKPQIALALPRHLNADRMARIAMTEWRKNPKLAECTMDSLLGSIITLSQLGLEPGVLGQGYLIPYKDICTPVPGWKGLVDIVNRSGRATVHSYAVYEGDKFEYEYGSSPFVKHKPNDDVDQTPENMTHCYAVGWVKGADHPVIEVWSKRKIFRHRDKYNKIGSNHYSFRHQEMYGRKIPLLQVLKYMPASVELQAALDINEVGESGETISMHQAGNGMWVPQNVDTSTGEILNPNGTAPGTPISSEPS